MTTTKAGHQLLLIDPSLDDVLSSSDGLTENVDSMISPIAGHQLLLIDPSLDDEHSSSDSEVLKEKLERMTTTEIDDQPRQTDDTDEMLLGDNDFRDTKRYVDVQLDLKEFYRFMQEFVIKEEFRTHIKEDVNNLDRIEEILRLGKNDLMKTECPIVIAGETSCGKSSLINLILGEKILPTGIASCMPMVCRVKYSERYEISTKDCNGKEQENMSFGNIEGMTEKIESLAIRDSVEIIYVDIYLPVPFLQGNVLVVDTPGNGYLESKEVADLVQSYIPNALAFVFVVNVANAGGIQNDKLLQSISKVRNSMDEMMSFDPKDVIFLLNKWDTIAHVEEELLEKYFETAKQVIRESWKEVKDSCIFQISAVKVSMKKEKYTKVFDKFHKVLKDVIARNKNKRVKIHLRYLNEFLDEFSRVLSTKLLCAKNAEENETKLNGLSTELEKLEENRKEELLNIERRIDIFLNEATTQLYEYVHNPHFRAEILKDTDTFTRFSIRRALDVRIKENLKAWQEQNLDNIFQKVIMEFLFKKFESIHRSLHFIKENLKGFQTPFDVDSKIITVIDTAITSNISLNLNFLLGLKFISEINRKELISIAAADIVVGIINLGLMIVHVDDFETTREKAFHARVHAFTKDTVKCVLREKYFEAIQKMKRAFLEGDLEKEMNKIKENISSMRNEHETFISQKETLSSMQKTVIQKIERLKQIGCIDIVIE